MKKEAILLEAVMLKLDDKIRSLSKLLSSFPQVQTVFLFGSYGTEYQSQHSDIDFAVYFDRDMTVNEEAAFLNKLSIALDTDRVDLLNLNKAPLILQFNAVADSRIIYERDYFTTCDYIERVVSLYQDYVITLSKFHRDYDLSLKEAYLDGQ